MDFENKCAVLSDLWINFSDVEGLEDFISQNDIGFPLAYLVASELVIPTDGCIPYVDETYSLLCESLEIDEYQEYHGLAEMFSLSKVLE
jgi:hypothetical protein